MTELNKVLLIGRLTKDPELRYTSGGTAVVALRLASNHTYRVKEEKKEEVLFIDVNVWGKSAELAKQYLQKGREVLVEGRLQQHEWTDKQTNQKRSTIRVNADRFSFMPGGRQGGERDGGGPPQEESGPPVDTFEGGGEPSARAEAPSKEKEDDLPF